MREKIERYHCDNCQKILKSSHNNLEIVTSKSEINVAWERLHVVINRTHGCHNDFDTDPADLCKSCAIHLLSDAIKRIENGERITKGVESSDQGNWE